MSDDEYDVNEEWYTPSDEEEEKEEEEEEKDDEDDIRTKLKRARNWLKDRKSVDRTADFLFEKAVDAARKLNPEKEYEAMDKASLKFKELGNLFSNLYRASGVEKVLPAPTKQEIKEYFKQADANNDKEISQIEWRQFVFEFISSKLVILFVWTLRAPSPPRSIRTKHPPSFSLWI